MNDTVDDVVIVGGGDIGLLTGLCVRQLNHDIDVSIVDNFQQDPPQVGKSTFYKIVDVLHTFLGIDERRFIEEVKPIWKCTVFFRDWCGCEPFHYPFDLERKFPPSNTPKRFQFFYHLYKDRYADDLTINEEIVAQGKSPWFFDVRQGSYQQYRPIAYHLDLERFNGFLRTLCRERGVSLIDDEITAVESDGDRIARVRSKSQAYEADLYVDATGFTRILASHVDGEFRDFDLPLDSAVKTNVERPLSEVIPATVIDSGDSGWFWNIDTYDDRDLGYVYASEFISDEDAIEEFLEHCGDGVTEADVTKYEFTSGYYEDSWIENAVIIGNAGGFVEPLESTGLTFNAEAAVRLSVLLSSHGRFDDEAIRDTYNAWWRACWESIYDFIFVHYKFAPGETPFWQEVRSLEFPPRVERIVREFDRNGLDASVSGAIELGANDDTLVFFRNEDFYMLMRNMGCTSSFYEGVDYEVDERVEQAAAQMIEQNAGRVEQDFITTEEFYRGVDSSQIGTGPGGQRGQARPPTGRPTGGRPSGRGRQSGRGRPPRGV